MNEIERQKWVYFQLEDEISLRHYSNGAGETVLYAIYG